MGEGNAVPSLQESLLPPLGGGGWSHFTGGDGEAPRGLQCRPGVGCEDAEVDGSPLGQPSTSGGPSAWAPATSLSWVVGASAESFDPVLSRSPLPSGAAWVFPGGCENTQRPQGGLIVVPSCRPQAPGVRAPVLVGLSHWGFPPGSLGAWLCVHTLSWCAGPLVHTCPCLHVPHPCPRGFSCLPQLSVLSPCGESVNPTSWLSPQLAGRIWCRCGGTVRGPAGCEEFC